MWCVCVGVCVCVCVCVCCVQVQYWPEAENKLSYGNISVSCKTVDTVNDGLVTTTLELYRNGSIAAVSKHLLLAGNDDKETGGHTILYHCGLENIIMGAKMAIINDSLSCTIGRLFLSNIAAAFTINFVLSFSS